MASRDGINGSKPVSVAILGAGIFVRDEHLPALLKCSNIEIKAIYSRSRKSVEALLVDFPEVEVDIYSEDTPAHTLDDLLANPHIQVVDLVLPISIQPSVLRRAWAAGKHTISEKPVAGTFEEASILFKDYKQLPSSKPLWAVAEQFRYLDILDQIKAKLQDLGQMKLFSFNFQTCTEPGSKYYETKWRQDSSFPGYCVDGGVHFAAGLRALVASPPAAVCAFSRQLSPYLPPADTFNASVRCESGLTGSFNISFAASHFLLEFNAVCESGTLTFTNMAECVVKNSEGEIVDKLKFESGAMAKAIQGELQAFVDAVADGRPIDPRGSPEEALKDLALIHYCLESGKAGGVVQNLA